MKRCSNPPNQLCASKSRFPCLLTKFTVTAYGCSCHHSSIDPTNQQVPVLKIVAHVTGKQLCWVCSKARGRPGWHWQERQRLCSFPPHSFPSSCYSRSGGPIGRLLSSQTCQRITTCALCLKSSQGGLDSMSCAKLYSCLHVTKDASFMADCMCCHRASCSSACHSKG